MVQGYRDYCYLRPEEMTAALAYGIAKVIELNAKTVPGKYFSAVEIHGIKFVGTGAPILINAKYLPEG